MATKAQYLAMVLTVCSLLAVMGNTVGARSLHDDETYEVVQTTDGSDVLFGASNTYSILARDMGIWYLFRFFFGLGYEGDPVRTDTAITMGAFGDASKIYACNDSGMLELVDVSSEGTPQNALIRVRLNTTDNYYRLQITESSPPVYVQFVYLSQGGLLCQSGVAGSPLQFSSSSSSSAASSQFHLDDQLPLQKFLRQVVVHDR